MPPIKRHWRDRYCDCCSDGPLTDKGIGISAKITGKVLDNSCLKNEISKSDK